MSDKTEYLKSIYPELQPYTLYCSKCGRKMTPIINAKLLEYDQWSGNPIHEIRAVYKCEKFMHDSVVYTNTNGGRIMNWRKEFNIWAGN